MNIYIKWFLIVGLNALLGFMLGMRPDQIWFQVGMICGVLSWWVAYASFDLFLIKQGKDKQSRRLMISALLRVPLQFAMLPDMYAGIVATETVRFIGLNNSSNDFFTAYITTIFTGLYLSFMCGFIYLLVSGVVEAIKVRKNA